MVKVVLRASIVLMLSAVFSQYYADAQIAPGVQQSAAQTASITGTVIQDDGTPVVGATVQLIGPAMLVTKSDVHGTFVFTSVPYGAYRIIATAVNLGTASRDNIVLKGDVTIAIQYVGQSRASRLKTIARVSTQSAGAQINITPASIASVNPSDYAFKGNTSWKQLLNQIPGVVAGGALAEGKAQSDYVPDAPFSPVVLSINGALPYETSASLDGMPLENTSFATNSEVGFGTDLSFLPMPMFDTADVVRGPGADAPSIVDSIGGSFVLHAPGPVDKNLYQVSLSNDPYGGTVANAKAALRVGRLSATITYSVNDSPGPLGDQSVVSSYAPTPLTINGQAFNGCSPGGPSSCASFIRTNNYKNCFTCGGTQETLLYCCIPNSTAWVQHAGALALSYTLTPSITAQLFYAGSAARMLGAGFQSPANFAPAAGYTGSISPGMYTFICTEDPTELSQGESTLEEKITAHIGHGILRLAALQNNSFVQYTAVYPTFEPNGQYTLYGTGYYTATPNTQTNFNGTSASLTFSPFAYAVKAWENNRDLLLNYATQIGSTSSVGFSYTTSYYNGPAEQLFYCGPPPIPSLSTLQPTAVSESTNEIRINAGTELSDRLSLNASWYFARGLYHVQNPNDSSGNTYVDSTFPYSAPRLSATWRASRDIAIRASAGGGYALPPLYYLVGSNGSPRCTSGTYCTVSLTNLSLTPEKSFGFDLGTDIRFHRDTVISFDLYRTNLYGQFFTSAAITGTCSSLSMCPAGSGALPLYTTQYRNLSQSRMEGINLDVRHDVPRGIFWHGAVGLTRGYVVSVPAGFYNTAGHTCVLSTGVNCQNTYIVPGINFDGQFQSTVPYTNGTAQIGYSWSPEKYIDISPTYYGNNNSYFVPAFLEFDAHAGYPLTRNVSLLATFRNITGIHGQSYEYFVPSMGAPTVSGLPYPLTGIPYGPRTLIVTASFKY